MVLDQSVEGPPHIGQCLRALAVSKRREAVTICEGRVQNGSEFVDRIASLSLGLRKLGLQSGGRVAIAALNSEWYLEWLLAVPCAGGIIAPLNHRWSVEEARDAIQLVEASILVVDAQCMGWCTELKGACPSLTWIVYVGSRGKPDKIIPVDTIIQLAGTGTDLQLFYSPNSIALICFTSGTTGKPKGVSLSHNALIVQSSAKLSVIGYSYNDVYLHTATMCHIGGISSALAMVMANGCHIILPKFQAAAVFESIDEHKASTMIVVPAMLNDMVCFWKAASRTHDGKDRSRAFLTVRMILNGAGSLSSIELEVVKKIFPASRIMSAYGMTEACSSMTFLLVNDPQPTFGRVSLVKEILRNSLPRHSEGWQTFHHGGVCVGKPAPHVEIRINLQKKEPFDKSMSLSNNSTAMKVEDRFSISLPGDMSLRDRSSRSKELSPVGNVLTRGAHVMDGYWGQPLQTRETLWADGWLDTGDIGWMDELGQLWLLGRQKDVVKSGGENVYASEVEGVLVKHPAVLTAAVVGVPDTRLGEAVAALVNIRTDWRWECDERTKKGSPGRVVTETLLRVHCQHQGLSRYKVPKFVVMQEAPFPTTSTGKVKKDQVRSMLKAQLDERHFAKGKSVVPSKYSISDDQKIIRSHL